MSENVNSGLSGASPAKPRDPDELQTPVSEPEQMPENAALGNPAAAASDEQLVRELEDRDKLLGNVRQDPEPEVVVVEKEGKKVTDKFFGSLGLFLLRVVMAALLAVIGWQVLVDQGGYADALTGAGVPANVSGWLALAAGIGMLLACVLLLIGWGTRIVGLLLTVAGVAVLAFFRFGPFNPIMEGHTGFYGDRDLLFTVCAFLMFMLGAGGWSVDAAYRRSRDKRKNQD